MVITDHLITARPSFQDPTREDPDGAPPYAGSVALYYPRQLSKSPDNELLQAMAQVREQSNIPTGLIRLAQVIQRFTPQRSEPYFTGGSVVARRPRR